jgi:hypothetical protein
MAENQGSQGGASGGRRQNPADNLSHADRVRGGERSSKMQRRDGQGQFAGRRNSDEAQSAGEGSSRSSRGGNSSDEGGSMGRQSGSNEGMQS